MRYDFRRLSVILCLALSISGRVASAGGVFTFIEGRVDAVDLLIPTQGEPGPASVFGFDLRGGLEWELSPYLHWQPVALDGSVLAAQTLQQFAAYAAFSSLRVRLGDLNSEVRSYYSVELAAGATGQVAGGILAQTSEAILPFGQVGLWLTQEKPNRSELSFGFETRMTPRGGYWSLGLRWRPLAWAL